MRVYFSVLSAKDSSLRGHKLPSDINCSLADELTHWCVSHRMGTDLAITKSFALVMDRNCEKRSLRLIAVSRVGTNTLRCCKSYCPFVQKTLIHTTIQLRELCNFGAVEGNFYTYSSCNVRATVYKADNLHLTAHEMDGFQVLYLY